MLKMSTASVHRLWVIISGAWVRGGWGGSGGVGGGGGGEDALPRHSLPPPRSPLPPPPLPYTDHVRERADRQVLAGEGGALLQARQAYVAKLRGGWRGSWGGHGSAELANQVQLAQAAGRSAVALHCIDTGNPETALPCLGCARARQQHLLSSGGGGRNGGLAGLQQDGGW